MFYDIKTDGERIRQLRIQNQYTQETLAKKLNIDRSLLSHIETGKRGCTVDIFIQLSELFDVSLDLLILGKDHDSKNNERPKQELAQLINHLEAFRNGL